MIKAVLPLAASAADSWVRYTPTIPKGWTDIGSIHDIAGEHKMNVTFAIRISDDLFQKLEEKFYAVSTPGSADYQDFLSKEQVDQFLNVYDDCKTSTHPHSPFCVKKFFIAAVDSSAEPDTVQSVKTYTNRLVFEDMLAKNIEHIFQTKLRVYEDEYKRRLIRCDEEGYGLPSSVVPSIAFVEGLAEFYPMPKRKDGAVDGLREQPRWLGKVSEALVVPQTLASMYNYSLSDLVSSRMRQMPGEADAFVPDGGSFLPSDLKTFLKGTGLPDEVVSHVSGSGTIGTPGIEGSLDVQYIVSTGLGAENWYFTTPGWVYSLISTVASWKVVPHSISMSFGGPEDGQCQVATKICHEKQWDAQAYVNAVNVEFMKMGLRGTSLFTSSGDNGAGFGEQLSPAFPASSPYITTVGGTQFESVSEYLPASVAAGACGDHWGIGHSQCAAKGVEQATEDFQSGGGFSNFTATPKYQQDAVSKYLASSVPMPNASCFNAQGRGYPDVSALGINYQVQNGGSWTPVGGTSASAPVWAGIASRLSDRAINITGKPLGFLNPLLYKMYGDDPTYFQDITTGNNGGTDPSEGCLGFTCAPGWDAVTGLGTPNVGKILDALPKYLKKIDEQQHKILAYPSILGVASIETINSYMNSLFHSTADSQK